MSRGVRDDIETLRAREVERINREKEAAKRPVVVTSLSQLDWLVEVIAETTERRSTP